MRQVLSARQQAEARKATELKLDTTATVRRIGGTQNATGKGNTTTVVYEDIPAHIAPGSDTNPTTTTTGQVSTLDQPALAWFPLLWPDARTPVPDGEDPVPVAVVIKRGDLIECGGQTWRAASDQDPAQLNSPRVRVRISRPHGQVNA